MSWQKVKVPTSLGKMHQSNHSGPSGLLFDLEVVGPLTRHRAPPKRSSRSSGRTCLVSCSGTCRSSLYPGLELGPVGKKLLFLAWWVENKGTPKKATKQKEEGILGKYPEAAD